MFFFIIQDVLFDEIQVSLSKLTDPAKTGKHENLSLENLQNHLELYGNSVLAQRNRTILDTLQAQSTPFREWRNKQLAHLDLLTSMKSSSNPLPDISREMIEKALFTLRKYLNEIELYYNDAEFGYENFNMDSDGEALLATLKAGLRYEELLQERKISWDDWQHGKWHDA